jgi:flagellar FliL protein
MADDIKEPETSEFQDENVLPIGGEGEDKKKNLKLILFIAVPALLLIVGGAGLYFTGTLDKIMGKESAESGHAEGKNAVPAEVAFLKIPDMIVNLNTAEGGAPRYLRLSVQLELASQADVAAVEKVLPRVVDQFQTYLRELRVQDLRGSKGMYRLQMELLSRVNAAAAPIQVKDVLFQEILIQ